METRTRNDPFNPKPKGLLVASSFRRIQLLELLYEYRQLPTSYIHRLLGKHYGTELIALFNGEGYIMTAPGTEKRLDARNREHVWTVVSHPDRNRFSKAEAMVGRKFLPAKDHVWHRLLISLVQFSFDIAPQEVPNLRKRTLEDILGHDNCPPETRGIDNPSFIPDPGIQPDAPLFGYEYVRADGRKRYFYLHGFEADRATEQRRGFVGRQTIQRKVYRYAQYLRSGGYHSRYGLSNCSIAFVTFGNAAFTILDIIRETVPEKELRRYFLVKGIPNFTESKTDFPPPMGHMATEDWQTTEGPLNITEVLRG